jgi:hypothetical protein
VAPHTASASADISVLMNVVSSSRSRSGDAWASCSSTKRAGSILDVTVIAVSLFESVVRDHSKDHPMAVAHSRSDTLTGIRTPLCWTQLIPDSDEACTTRREVTSRGLRQTVQTWVLIAGEKTTAA